MFRWALPALSWFACATPTVSTTGEPVPPVAAEPESESESEVELATLMLRFQVHADKLWFAGAAENWPLTEFYLHELGETLEEIVDADLVDAGHAVSAMAASQLGPALTAVEAAAHLDGDFEAAYDRLVGACNACHEQADYSFVVIQRPTAPAYTNQDFAPRP